MNTCLKKEILKRICYTELVYQRVNKKMCWSLSRTEIEEKIVGIIKKTEECFFIKKGKNVYVTNKDFLIRITININTCRLITVDQLKE